MLHALLINQHLILGKRRISLPAIAFHLSHFFGNPLPQIFRIPAVGLHGVIHFLFLCCEFSQPFAYGNNLLGDLFLLFEKRFCSLVLLIDLNLQSFNLLSEFRELYLGNRGQVLILESHL